MANTINELYSNYVLDHYHVGKMIKSNIDDPEYAVFKMTWDSYKYDKAEEFNSSIFYEVFTASSAHSCTIFSEGRERFDNKEDAKGWLGNCRMWYNEERRRDWRYSNYKSSFSIHQCDSRGDFVPTLSEVKNAVKYYLAKDEKMVLDHVANNDVRNVELLKAIVETIRK